MQRPEVLKKPERKVLDMTNGTVCGSRLPAMLQGIKRRPAHVCLQECRTPKAADDSASYGHMCYFDLSEVREQRTVLCVRTDMHKQMKFKLTGVTRFRVARSCEMGDKKATMMSIYMPPAGSKSWAEEMVTDVEIRENHVADD